MCTQVQEEGTARVVASQVVIRNSPGLDGKKIGNLQSGDLVGLAGGIPVIERDGHIWRPMIVWVAGDGIR